VLEFAITQKNATLIGECALRLIGIIHIKRREFDEADKYIGLVIDQNTRLRDPWLEAMVDTTRAFLYSRRGYLGAAEQFCQNALKIYLKLENKYDIAVSYRMLGSFTISLAVQDLEEAIDESGTIQTQLATAQRYFDNAETYLEQEREDHGSQYSRSVLQVNRAIIARLQGDLGQARDLLQSCIGKFQSSFSVANVYRELALVEHLAGNKELAYSYEERGLSLFRQLGMLDVLPPHHCYKVIDRMKQDGMW
jgi:tetratricopeptide (TPR) repeat protein